jgi:hypothetical protein
MDSTIEHAINLFFDGRVLKFEECSDGLNYLDMSKSGNYSKSNVTNNSKSSPSKLSFMQMVNSNKEFFQSQKSKKLTTHNFFKHSWVDPAHKHLSNTLIII